MLSQSGLVSITGLFAACYIPSYLHIYKYNTFICICTYIHTYIHTYGYKENFDRMSKISPAHILSSNTVITLEGSNMIYILLSNIV